MCFVARKTKTGNTVAGAGEKKDPDIEKINNMWEKAIQGVVKRPETLILCQGIDKQGDAVKVECSFSQGEEKKASLTFSQKLGDSDDDLIFATDVPVRLEGVSDGPIFQLTLKMKTIVESSILKQKEAEAANAKKVQDEIASFKKLGIKNRSDNVVWLYVPHNEYGQRIANKETAYYMNFGMVFQKVKDGYIFRSNPYHTNNLVAFLFVETKRELQKTEGIAGHSGWLMLVGTYTYQSLDGYQRTLPRFRCIENLDLKVLPISN